METRLTISFLGYTPRSVPESLSNRRRNNPRTYEASTTLCFWTVTTDHTRGDTVTRPLAHVRTAFNRSRDGIKRSTKRPASCFGSKAPMWFCGCDRQSARFRAPCRETVHWSVSVGLQRTPVWKVSADKHWEEASDLFIRDTGDKILRP